MVRKIIREEIWNNRNKVYQESLSNLADDFNHGMITFEEFEKCKKTLREELFGNLENPYMG